MTKIIDTGTDGSGSMQDQSLLPVFNTVYLFSKKLSFTFFLLPRLHIVQERQISLYYLFIIFHGIFGLQKFSSHGICFPFISCIFVVRKRMNANLYYEPARVKLKKGKYIN